MSDLLVNGYAEMLSTTSADTARTTGVQSKISSTGEGSSNEELLEAAKSFESYLWEQVLKEMKKSVDLFSGDSSNYSQGMVDLFGDQMIQTLAEQTTESGGPNSLAQTLYEQMKRTYGTE